MNKKYVIGLDFGTDSARAVLIDASNGDELSSSVKYYPRWMEGKYCDPSKQQYRQHPKDYLEVMTFIIKDILNERSKDVREIDYKVVVDAIHDWL